MSIRKQCSLLCIHRGQFYYQLRQESNMNLHLMRIIDKQYLATPFYGVPRMTAFINQNYAYQVNCKRIRRLYKLMDIRAIGPIPFTSRSNKSDYKFPYLLGNLEIDKPNQVWAADITYIGMHHGFMYLFAIIDLYSRYIVNWGLSNTMTAEWCVAIIQEAFLLNPKPDIFNTDQGTQFTSSKYTNLLKENDVQISMDGKGRAIDNIFIERFWRSVKQEYIYINPANGGFELYNGVEEYMRFYNYERGHESLAYKTPAEKYYGKKVIFESTKYLTSVV